MPLLRRLRLPLLVALVLLLVALAVVGQKIRLPRPQVASAQGQLAPDFTLLDQDGKPVHLADLRGSRVLLIFYRGYW